MLLFFANVPAVAGDPAVGSNRGNTSNSRVVVNAARVLVEAV
jgi:hypothetical protein